MRKEPKYKKGYTWAHHFDEWWDRREAVFKAKIFCFGVLGLVLATLGAFYFGCNRFEKRDLIRASVEAKNYKIQDSDKSIRRIAHEETHLPAFQSARSSDVRPGSED